MNKPEINTDKVITTTKKTLYELREIDHKNMSKEEKEAFKEELDEIEGLALSILEDIKDKED